MQPIHMALIVAALGCFTDWRSRRIPNVLTFPAALAAIGMAAATTGVHGALSSAEGWAAGVALFVPFFALGGLGGGDVKLLGAIGAWVGPAAVLQVALYAAMTGGVFALALALRRGYLATALRNLAFLLTFWTTVGLEPVEGLTLAQPNAPKLAYAFPVLSGVLVTAWLH